MQDVSRAALSVEEIAAQIAEHIEEYAAGGPDCEGEDVALGQVARISGDWVKAQWTDARKRRALDAAVRRTAAVEADRRDGEPKGSFKNPPPQPSIAPKVEEPPKAQLPAVVPVPIPAAPVLTGTAPRADWDAVVVRMNTQHAVIDNWGGKTVIACWEASTLDPERSLVVPQGKESFLLRYSNQHATFDVAGKRLAVPLGEYWLRSPLRQQYRGVTFRPGGPGVVAECLNLWRGWGVEAAPGDWGLIRQHIVEVIAGGDAAFADYVLRWIAWSVQNPGSQAEVTLVLIGEKGTGKGTLVRALQRIFGDHAFQATSQEHVIGRFNGHLQDCVLFVADEAYWGGDKRCIGRLQGMITEPTLTIERKGLDAFPVPNLLHVMMLAEPGWVIPAGRYERRYAPLAVSSARRGDRAYFKAVHEQIANGGAAAMFWDLRGMDLGDWHPREIPDAILHSEAMQRQQGFTLPPLDQWYLALLHLGRLPGRMQARPRTVLTQRLIEDARQKVPRLQYLTDVELRNFLVEEVGCDKYRAALANGWTFPPLAEARAAFARRYGQQAWDSDVEDWQ